MENGKNGSFKVAFWVLSFITSVWLVGLTNAVVANDRLRATEDLRVEARVETIKDTLHSIDVRLSRIETKMGIINDQGRIN